MTDVRPAATYFLYARKSTDTEDKQIQSIDDQLSVLREFAGAHHLPVIETLIERQSARTPGRPVFNAMLHRIAKGDASGILAWHPNRLSRNSMDSGYLVYLMDQNKLLEIRTPGQAFTNTPNDKFLLNLLCSQAKLENDNKGVDVRRALQQKAKRGIFPGQAPVGYLNDPVTRTIVRDPHAAPMVIQIFQRYAAGTCSLRDLKELFDSGGLRSVRGAELSLSNYQDLLSNPFYYGLFRYTGELYEGKHEPLVAKSLFDQAQAVMHNRSKPRKHPRQRRLYQGIFRCGECGGCITTETQKGHNYLRCTKKRCRCSQPYVREDAAVLQVQAILRHVTVPKSWIPEMQAHFRNRRTQEEFTSQEQRSTLHRQISECDQRLDRLTTAYIDHLLTGEEFTRTKATFINEKAAAKAQLALFESNPTGWLERAERFIARLNEAVSVVSNGNPDTQRDFLKKICSNLTVKDGAVHNEFQPLWKYVATEGRPDPVKPVARQSGARTPVSIARMSCRVPSMRRRSNVKRWVVELERLLKDN